MTARSPLRPGRLARAAALLPLAAAAAILAACDDKLFVEPAPPLPSALNVVYSVAAAGGPSDAYDKVDRLSVQLARGGTVLLDSLIDFSPSATETRVRLEIEVEDDEPPVDLAFELRRTADAIFRGEQSVRLRRGDVTTVQMQLEPVVAGVSLPDEVPVITALGDTVPIDGAALFATGDTIPDVPLEWSSSDPGIVTVEPDGRVISRGEGQARVRAAFGAFRDSVDVRVQAIVDTVTVTPPSAEVPVAGEVQLEAAARDRRGNALDRTIAWASSDASVAAVDQSGRVDANAIGEATISASAEGRTGSAAITVRPVGSVAITGITRAGTTTPVDPADVTGRIDVALSAEAPAGAADRIEVLVGDDRVCSTAFTGGTTTTTCTVDTAEFNSTTGAVRFLNGNHTLTARVVGTAGHTLNRAATELVFGNADTFYGRATGARGPARDPDGRDWWAGDIIVTAIPVMYSGAAVTQATVALPSLSAGGDAPATGTRTVTATAGSPFVAVFPVASTISAGGVAAANTGPAGSKPFIASSVLASGQAGPSGAFVNDADADSTNHSTIRVDNEPPARGTFILTEQSGTTACCLLNWVGKKYLFRAGKAGHDDMPFGVLGVDSLEVTFHVGAAALTDSQLVAQAPDTIGGQLDETSTTTAMRAVARIRDNLLNTSIVALQPTDANPTAVAAGATFGVDTVAPTAAFTATSADSGAVFNIAAQPAGEVFEIVAADTLSGLTAMPVALRVLRRMPGLSPACATGTVDPETGECMPLLDDLASPVPEAEGYYEYAAVVRDRAGNESPKLNAEILVDLTAPAATDVVAVPATLTGNVAASFSVPAVDNLDLGTAQLRIGFGGDALPFSAPVLLGTFGQPFATSATAVSTISFVRSLEATDGAGAPDGTLTAAGSAAFTLRDVAGNSSMISSALSGVPAGTGAADLDVASFAMTAPAAGTQVCNDVPDTPDCTATKSVTLQAAATGPSGFANPFARVHFYRVDAAGDVHLIGTSGNAAVSESGGVRTWTWSLAFAPTDLPAQDPVQIFAVGVDAAGDGLRSGDLAIEIIDGS